MAKSSRKPASDDAGPGGFLGGLTALIEKLGELAEKGEELKGLKEFGDQGGLHGVYGFTIKSNLGGGRGGDGGGPVRVEPFGNVRKESGTGRVKVHEVAEPPADVFEEEGHVLVVLEMPGVAAEDVAVELHGDILTVSAEKGPRKYRKEVLLPESFPEGSASTSCRNGVVEVRLAKRGS